MEHPVRCRLVPAAPLHRALRRLGRQVGAAPQRLLFETLAGPLGRPRIPGETHGGYRTVFFDHCRSTKVPDTAANRGRLGNMNASLGVTGHPVIQLMTLADRG